MAIRCTDEEIEAIIEIDSSITDLTPFKTAANIIVDAKLLDTDLEESTLKEIERWLSAHFVTVRDTRSSKEQAGSVLQSFQYKVYLDLRTSMYGQAAMAVDTTGILKTLCGKGGSATIGTIKPGLWET